jgi:predicted oxidoreductase (fatty acid repression mutant protein)
MWNWSTDSSKLITFDENCKCWIYDNSSSLIGIIENISINNMIWNIDSSNIAIISNENNIKIWNMTDESLQSSIVKRNDDEVNNFNKTIFFKKTTSEYRQTRLSSIQKQYRHEFSNKLL